MTEGIIAAVGSLLNGGWAFRLETKAAATDEKLDGVIKITDERHAELNRRLDRIEDKVDQVLGLALNPPQPRR